MTGELTTAMKASDNITELAKKAKISDAVLDNEAAWDSVPEMAIQKCFRWGSIHEEMGQCEGKPTSSEPLNATDKCADAGLNTFKVPGMNTWPLKVDYRLSNLLKHPILGLMRQTQLSRLPLMK